jgi:putative heme degradation protein
LLARFLASNETLVAHAAENGSKRVKIDFDVATLKRKWHAFSDTYNKCKKEYKVGQEAGETAGHCPSGN